MRWLLPLLLSSLVLLALSLGSAGAETRRGSSQAGGEVELPLSIPRVKCERPRALELSRFEDGSAQLRCAGRLLVRVAVPR